MPSALVQENYSLKDNNTFGLSAHTQFYASITEEAQLLDLYKSQFWGLHKFILGGGSNILLLNDFQGLVIHLQNKGIEILEENEDTILLKVQAGEIWHDFVLHCIHHGWAGVENLSLIPGSVGAAPMQNIGAYGVEIKSVFESLEAFNIESGEWHFFTKEQCEFGYRSSIFKTHAKGQFIITSVNFRLNLKPKLNLSYGAIQTVLNEKGITDPTIKDVSEAVIQIRQSKLPDPKEIGNSGSFFKNPVVPNNLFHSIQHDFPNMPFYPVDSEHTKIPAGWLIEQCGWKGKIVGETGCHKHQALVIVNYGNATGAEILQHAKNVITSVKEKFNITLAPEVNIIQ